MIMVEVATKVPVKNDPKAGAQLPGEWGAFDSLRRQVDRLFHDFERGWDVWRPTGRSVFDLAPAWPTEMTWGTVPAVDVAEKDKAYEVTAELPGMDEKNVEVKVSNGVLTIKGEKKDEKEEKRKGYYYSERRFGSFQRSFRVPEGVDADKIEASFKNGVLTVNLPKTADAQKQEKKIAVKAA
jgi:HSP20 family protein